MISVIIPTYNSARTIAATLASVCRQTYTCYEVIITDDGSSDRTLEICEEYASEHPEMQISTASIAHSGVAAARNNALARASGDYVSFLDSDDRWMPEKLERVAALISRDPQANLIYHDALILTLDGGRLWKIGGPPSANPYCRLLLDNNFLSTSGVTAQRSWVTGVGGFNCDPNFEICEDYYLWVGLARAGARFAYIPAILAEIVKTEGSLSSNISRHMRNRLHVSRHCLRQAFNDGVLSRSEWQWHSNRVAAWGYAAISGIELRQRHRFAAAWAAAAAARPCLMLVFSGDWDMLRQLGAALLRRIMPRSLRTMRWFRPTKPIQKNSQA